MVRFIFTKSIRKEQELAGAFGIRSIPTILLSCGRKPPNGAGSGAKDVKQAIEGGPL